MTFWEYVGSKLLTLCFLALGLLACWICAAFAGVSGTAFALFLVPVVLVVAGWLTAGYLLGRKKLERLESLLDQLPEKYLLAEVLPPPSNLTERLYGRVVQEVSRSAIDIAEQSRREKEAYCSYVESWIHELKTPLTACSLILANGGDPRKLRTELKRADNLTQTILYYARLRSAEKDTLVRPFHAAQLMEQAVKNQMELLIAAKIRVQTEGDFVACSDDKAVGFVLNQLLINAAKYCPGCLVQMQAEAGRITVRDNGIGIPAHEVDRVTERGFTGTNGRAQGSSTGMGLYISRELCRQLDIGLEIQSKPGQGTTITLDLTNLTKM